MRIMPPHAVSALREYDPGPSCVGVFRGGRAGRPGWKALAYLKVTARAGARDHL